MKFDALMGLSLTVTRRFDELVNRQRMFLPEERLSSFVWELQGGCACGGK